MEKTEMDIQQDCWAIAGVLEDARCGDRDAQCAVGERFWYGDLVHRDRKLAIHWYDQAAQQGHPYAQCCLGYAYALGEGAEKDPEKSVYWYTQAAHQGDVLAMRALAACYARGFGVEQDAATAYDWVSRALLQYKHPPMTPEGFDRP